MVRPKPRPSGLWLRTRGLSGALLSLTLFTLTLHPVELKADEPLKAPRAQEGRGAERPLLGVSPEATPLVRHLLRVAWEGSPVPIKLIPELDGAREALRDQVISAAIFVSAEPPHPKAIAIAQTPLWWVTRGDQRSLSQRAWRELLKASSKRAQPALRGGLASESNAERTQLCLRALPDPLEEAWVALNPQQGALLKRAREEGRALIFYDDQLLLKHLARHPSAVALFDLGRLRLFGAPLAQVQIERQRSASVTIWYLEAPQSASAALSRWGDFLRKGEHLPWLRDLGWGSP